MSPDNTKTENALAIIENSNLPVAVREQLQLEATKTAKEMMDNIDYRPPKIKIAPGGSNNFLFGKDETASKSFRGIVLGFIKANAFWLKISKDGKVMPGQIEFDLPEGFNPDLPICFSLGGIVGSRPVETVAYQNKPVTCFGHCDKSECFINNFGTAIDEHGNPGKGKACKNGRRLVVIPEGEQLPFIFTIPPTSLSGWDSYIAELASKKIVIWTIWTRFGLEKESGGSYNYSTILPTVDQPIEEELLSPICDALTNYKSKILKLSIEEEEFVDAEISDA